MNGWRFPAAVATGIVLWLGIAFAQTPPAQQPAAGRQGGGARQGGPPPQGGQGGFVAYPQRPVSDPAAVDRGKAMFSANCGFCHGPDARGGCRLVLTRLACDQFRQRVPLRPEQGAPH